MPTIARLLEYIEVNPKEVLSKGTVARKISMDKLQPFCRDIPEYELAKFSGGTKFRNGDTIMARITPCLENGKTAMVNILAPGEVGFGSTEFIVFRAKAGFTDPNFVYYLIISSIVRGPAVKSMVGSSGRQRVQTDVIQNLEVVFPELSDQKKIAGILKTIDDRIALNNKINENLYEQLTSYYKHLFSAITPSTSVGELVDSIFSGGTPSTSNEAYWNGDHYWLSSGETSERFIVSTIKTITDAGASNSSTRKANKYDIVIASAGQGHTRGQTSMLLTDTYVNQSIIVVHAAPDYLPYLFWNIANRYEELRVISNSNSIRGSLTTKMIGSLSIPKADITQIRQFSDYAWPIVKAVENNLHENRRLAVMRDTLLPRLMSGELDVSALDL